MASREPARALASLTRIARRHEPGTAARKLQQLAVLARARLATARQLLRLHEILVFLDAYPDDRRVHARVRRMLRDFRRRPDFPRHRAALIGSGIAGTDTPYRFYWPTARWISQGWPGALTLERGDPDHERAILSVLPELLEPSQAEWLRGQAKQTIAVLDRLRPKGVTDADFLIGLVARMQGDEFSREAFFDRMDPPFVLRAGPDTPQRSTARLSAGPVHYRRDGFDAPRPLLRDSVSRPPQSVNSLRGRAVAELIRVARFSMITRERDLAVFQYPEPRDAFLVQDGAGLEFAMIGIEPARRALLPATYAGLTLINGVPIGYVQVDVLGRHAALSFNTFETFRNSEARQVFARFVAVIHHLFGCDWFSVEPYQLGAGNDEGIESGAWWFYERFGFRPRNGAARRLAAREIARRSARAGHRSSPATLRALARSHLFFSLNPDVPARLPRIDVWLSASVEALRRYRPAKSRERFGRWTGLALAWTSRGHWSVAERRDLLRLAMAKDGRGERDYQQRLLRHRRLRNLLGC